MIPRPQEPSAWNTTVREYPFMAPLGANLMGLWASEAYSFRSAIRLVFLCILFHNNIPTGNQPSWKYINQIDVSLYSLFYTASNSDSSYSRLHIRVRKNIDSALFFVWRACHIKSEIFSITSVSSVTYFLLFFVFPVFKTTEIHLSFCHWNICRRFMSS